MKSHVQHRSYAIVIAELELAMLAESPHAANHGGSEAKREKDVD